MYLAREFEKFCGLRTDALKHLDADCVIFTENNLFQFK